jgi:uncharacterized Zn-binding protein involved in type VI secretion
MPVTVKVNGMSNSLVHKGSNGISTATIPDVCKTPSPGGPVPIPYPNISQSATLSNGSTTVKADGMMIAIKGSEFALSNGDNAGVAGGIKSSTFMKESTWILYSFDVKIDGQNACRLTDKKFQNHENTVDLAGTLQPIVGLTDWQARLLCEIFCACLGQSKANKQEALMPDLSAIDEPDFDPPKKPDPFGNQRCVEKELRQANHDAMRPEQAYNMRTSPPTPIPGAQRGGPGTRRPDVVVCNGAGPAGGSNLTAVVEMKFPGDGPRPGQYQAYRRVAKENNPNAEFVILNKKVCNCDDK